MKQKTKKRKLLYSLAENSYTDPFISQEFEDLHKAEMQPFFDAANKKAGDAFVKDHDQESGKIKIFTGCDPTSMG